METIVIAPQYRLRVKQRVGVVAYALEHGLKGASRRFGLDRKTVRAWVRRRRAAGATGLLPRYPRTRPTRLPDEVVRRIEPARRALRYGAPRTRIWLRRVHKRTVSIAPPGRPFGSSACRGWPAVVHARPRRGSSRYSRSRTRVTPSRWMSRS
ncbi:MAG: helix-turn-helix domain-containing protein [Deltaproteobacteria bacterium]|nr:helix-turn-helix domain-containing protein [Deltaproteobacteria bacterium]